MKPIVEHSNKTWETAVAKNFPSKCPKCNSIRNFIKKTFHDGVGSTVFVECSNCHWKKEITPWELV